MPKADENLLSRRTFLDGVIGFAGIAAASGVMAQAAKAAKPAVGAGMNAALFPMHRSTNSNSSSARVEIDSGKIKGYVSRGIYTFKGIPYGDDTGGANRFTVAKKPKPWSGVRSCMSYGPIAPAAYRTAWNDDEGKWMFDWTDGYMAEDCLRINVWTPSINDNAKRAVMFWIHGGVYVNGSSQEMHGYDGENLAKHGDVVVVSINHRLNVLGFLDLAKYGEEFKHSSNVSQLDIVAALEWVKANIANFGGDPNRVTIFGQSGGGGKVTHLLAMPSAEGLFHRAIIQSGSKPQNVTSAFSSKLADYVLEELQIPASNAVAVQKVPYDQLLAAGDRAGLRLRKEMPHAPATGLRQSGSSTIWQPIVDGDVIPKPVFYPTAPETSKNVPVIVGSTLNEFTVAVDHPEYELLTWDELKLRAESALRGKGDEAIRIYRRNSPKATAFEIWSQMNATTNMRMNAVEIAKEKSAQGAAAYNYQFRWQTPVLDGRAHAFHGLDICFGFNNTDLERNMTGGGDDARALAAKVSGAFVSFAKTGNPNHSLLPRWEAVSGDRVATMCFDNDCELKINHDEDERRVTTLA
jgi:para-nitrobenzyl esterase